MKTVYILIGARGSGKTYIGKLIDKELRIKFLLVEPYFLEAAKREDYKNTNNNLFAKIWQKIGEDIDNYLKNNEEIIFESLGVFDSFKNFLKNLKSKYNIKLIKINCPQNICFYRLKNRDPSLHVKIDKNDIEKIKESLDKEKYKFNLVIENENLSDDEILSLFKKLKN